MQVCAVKCAQAEGKSGPIGVSSVTGRKKLFWGDRLAGESFVANRHGGFAEDAVSAVRIFRRDTVEREAVLTSVACRTSEFDRRNK